MPSEIPLPLSLAFDNPIVKGMTPPERGAYVAIIDGFWREQLEIPDEEWKRAVMAKCSVKQWRFVRDKVLKAVDIVMPRLAVVYRKKLDTKEAMRRNGAMNGLRHQCRVVKDLTPLSDLHTDTLPVRPTRGLAYRGNGKSDFAAHMDAASRAAAPTKVRGGLSDRAGKNGK